MRQQACCAPGAKLLAVILLGWSAGVAGKLSRTSAAAPAHAHVSAHGAEKTAMTAHTSSSSADG
jgi:hypothetical protein